MAATGTLDATLGGLSLAASARVGIDRREEICVRLLAIAIGIAGVTRAARNRINISPGLGATIVIWNGDEEVVLNRPGRAPKIVETTPQLRVMVEATAVEVGTSLNRLRRRLLRAVLDDAELKALVGPNGEIRYDGLANNLEGGLKVGGEDWLTFAFRYPLLFDEL